MAEEAEEAWERFLEYDWSDARWQTYLQDLYPTPSGKQLLKFKKKWYKKNVEPSFDDTYEPSPAPSVPSSGGAEAGGAGARSGPMPLPDGIYADGSRWAVMGTKATICFVAYAVALTLATGSFAGVFSALKALVLLVCAFVLEILAKYGLKLKAEYLHAVLLDDVGTLPIMSVTLMTPGLAPWMRVLALASPCLTALLSFSQICKHHERLPGFVRDFFEPLAGNAARYKVMAKRADAEVALGVVLIFGVFTGNAAPVSVLLFWNFMMMRYIMSTWTQSTFRRLDRATSPVMEKIPGVKFAWRSLKAKLYSFVDPESEGAGKMCTIL